MLRQSMPCAALALTLHMCITLLSCPVIMVEREWLGLVIYVQLANEHAFAEVMWLFNM